MSITVRERECKALQAELAARYRRQGNRLAPCGKHGVNGQVERCRQCDRVDMQM